MTTSRKRNLIVCIAIIVIAAIALGVSMRFSRDIELELGLLYYEEASSSDPVASGGEGGSVTDERLPGLYINYLNVGQGDCTIIEFPDGKNMIIDAGKGYKSVKTAIDDFIDTAFGAEFKYFDYAILTHPDDDHCGSMNYVLEKYPARVSYRPNVEAVGTTSNPYADPGKSALSVGAVTKNTASYAKAIKAMYAQTADFTPTVYVTDPSDESQTIIAEDNSYTFTFYSPLSVSYSDWNDYSPIMILEYQEYKFALSGDAEHTNEEEFVAKVNAAATDGKTDKYDVFTDSYTVNAIKCGHHGSRTSTSQGYIDAITTPEGAANAYYIISCGKDNSYGHPHKETLSRLKSMGVPDDHVLRTDVLGDIVLSVEQSESGAYVFRVNNSPSTIVERVLVYKTLGGIELKWAVVAWSAFALLVILCVIYVAVGDKFIGTTEKTSVGRRK